VSDDATRERLAILVHEVRSPVAALSAIADTYGDDPLEHEARRSLADLALAACRGIERVVTDASVASLERATVDVGRVVSEAVDAARLRGLLVRAEVEPGLPTVQADAVRIRQVLDSLVSNAAVHADSGGEIRVRAYAVDGGLVLAVSDSGPGIPPSQHERIFEPGVRLDRDRPGSGIGLAVVRAIADAHGAALRLESAPGRGSTFSLELPLR
jgi:signal transduction histidine kinase